MAWIESHQELERHGKVLDLADIMGWSLDATIGKLHRFWWWCLDYAPTGDLRGVNWQQLGIVLGMTADDSLKFKEALVATHLVCRLTRTRLPFRIHDWIDYAGRYLRDTKFKRQPEKWSQVVELYQIPCQPTVSRQSADMSRHVSRQSADNPPYQPTKPTKPNQPNLPTADKSADGGFEEFWQAYPRKAGKGAAERAWAKIRPDEQLRATIQAAIQRAMTSVDWVKDNGQFIPHPATWLNQRRWEDEVRPASALRVIPKSLVDLLPS